MTALTTAAKAYEHLEPDPRDAEEARRGIVREQFHTRFHDATFCWNVATSTLIVQATNVGETALDAANVTIVADGAALTGVVAAIESQSGRLWDPGENATFNVTGAPNATRVVAFTEHGAAIYPVKVDCRILTTIVVSPSSATMTFGETRDFTVVGYDQYGTLFDGTPYTWSSAAGTTSALTPSSGRLVAGTTSGTFTMTATSGSASGSATILIHPGAPASVSVTPSPTNVIAGSTQPFTATVRDSYGNVNATSPVTWTTTAGTISSGGVLTASTTAQASRTVTATSGGVSGQATVHVVAGPVASVTVTPSSASVLTLGTQTFTAVGRDQHGNVQSSATFNWSATRGTITSAGVYTAPGTTGADTVTANANGVNGTASVTVRRDVHVSAMGTYKSGAPATVFTRGTDTVEVRVTVVDHLGNVVQGASVTVDYVKPNGVSQTTQTGTTNSTGVASVTYSPANGATQGDWTARVTGISGTNLAYVSSANTVTSVGFTIQN